MSKNTISLFIPAEYAKISSPQFQEFLETATKFDTVLVELYTATTATKGVDGTELTPVKVVQIDTLVEGMIYDTIAVAAKKYVDWLAEQTGRPQSLMLREQYIQVRP